MEYKQTHKHDWYLVKAIELIEWNVVDGGDKSELPLVHTPSKNNRKVLCTHCGIIKNLDELV